MVAGQPDSYTEEGMSCSHLVDALEAYPPTKEGLINIINISIKSCVCFFAVAVAVAVAFCF